MEGFVMVSGAMTAGKTDEDRDRKDLVLAGLRTKIEAIEKADRHNLDKGGEGRNVTPLALTPGLDTILPDGGLARGALHEVVGPPGAQGAAAGFAAALMGLAAEQQGVVLWCRRHYDGSENGELYGPGLAAFGLGPERLLEVRAGRDHDVLWALEEGLQSTALCAVLGEVSDLSFTASRRLQLAAEARGVMALVLRHNSQSQAVSAARTRWRVTPAPNTGSGYDIRWKLNLLRCRGATAESQHQDWRVEWHNGRLHDDGRGSQAGYKAGHQSGYQAAPRDFVMAATAGQRPGYPTEPGLAV
jgi:protein ImuA